MPIVFQHPIYLLVWCLIPVIWLMMRRSVLQGSQRRQQRLLGSIRSLFILLLGAGLANPSFLTHSDLVNLFFCLDVSESLGEDAMQAAQDFMQRAQDGMDPDDQAGVILFGKHPSVELSLRHAFTPSRLSSPINPHFTNIAAALRLAIGNLPQQGKARIVLFSDGSENVERAIDMAHLAASLGIEIYPIPLKSWFGEHEVFVNRIETPSLAPLETPFDTRVVITSSQDGQGELVVLRNDRLLAQESVTLRPGTNVFTLEDRLQEPGLYLYKAVINMPGDVYFQNNEGLAFTRGTRTSRILYLSAEQAAPSPPLVSALSMQGLRVIRKALNDVSGSLYELLEYDAIVLDNISGQRMSFTLMEHLEDYVKHMGGGLIMIGGDQSFGAGQYTNTPVENALPVFMAPPTDLTFSGLCLIFVIDKSSSMSGRYENQSKLEMAKIAAFSSIELLNPTDTVGIIAFDSDFSWLVPVIKANERQHIADQLSGVKQGGGTNLYPALEEAYYALQTIEASRKHVIVLSDGMTDEADFQTLTQAMSAADISVSTVAIGRDSARELLLSIAQWGNGRSYYTDHPQTIPKIFTGETKIVTKALIQEQPYRPTLTENHEIARGIDITALPVIYGQVITYPKPGASLIMTTPQGPLLAAWHYGLGRSAAFTSDLSGRWGKDWVRWEQYGQFTAQLVKWAQRQTPQQQYQASISRHSDTGTLTVDVTDTHNRFVNQRQLHMTTVFPSEKSQATTLEQISPGRYQGTFPADEIGAYYISVADTTADESQHLQVFGFGVPYTDEFSATTVNMPLLERLASLTKGAVLSPEKSPEDLFTVPSEITTSGTPLWPSCLLLALAALILDVAVRKIINLS